MNELTLDVETTTFQKGNPFSRRNRLCTAGLFDGITYSDYDIEYTNSPYGNALREIKETVEKADLVIGFNIKFDIHWLRRYIDDLSINNVWDCQLAHFILNGQRTPYPSLNDALEHHGLELKLDRVSNEFWANGIDTPEIPWDILAEYQEHDIKQTHRVYELQRKIFEEGDPRLYELFKLQCKDLLILEDAEYEGMRLNVLLSNERANETGKRLEAIREELAGGTDGRINWSSTDHISVFLYGGRISFKVREQVTRTLKSGEVKVRERWGTEEVEFPRIVQPLERSESSLTAKLSDEDIKRENDRRIAAGRRPIQRIYSVDDATLRGLKAKGRVKRIIELMLERAELEKLHGTYYKGLPRIIEEMDWPDGEMHGNLNQCVAITGRLTSSNPNLQNLAGESKPLYVSRYQ